MIRLNPGFTFPNFMLYVILHNSVGPYQMPLIERFPRYYTILCGAHTNTQQGFCYIHNNKNDYEHTIYPTPLKLNVKSNDHPYNEELIPQCQRVITSW